jgi:hypothetical protein
MALDWLVCYYAGALELPFPVLRSLLTHGLPIEQVQLDGRIELHVFGQPHCPYGPAGIWTNGTKYWFRNGQLHHDDGPAVEAANGYKAWYRNAQRHRDDGPAFEWPDGTKEWYRDDQQHRDNGPAVERPNGTTEYWRNGVRYWPQQK